MLLKWRPNWHWGPFGLYEFHITERGGIYFLFRWHFARCDREGNRITMFNGESWNNLVPENRFLSSSGDWWYSWKSLFWNLWKNGEEGILRGSIPVLLKSDQLTTKKIPLLECLGRIEIRLEAEISTIKYRRFYLHHRDIRFWSKHQRGQWMTKIV